MVDEEDVEQRVKQEILTMAAPQPVFNFPNETRRKAPYMCEVGFLWADPIRLTISGVYHETNVMVTAVLVGPRGESTSPLRSYVAKLKALFPADKKLTTAGGTEVRVTQDAYSVRSGPDEHNLRQPVMVPLQIRG